MRNFDLFKTGFLVEVNEGRSGKTFFVAAVKGLTLEETKMDELEEGLEEGKIGNVAGQLTVGESGKGEGGDGVKTETAGFGDAIKLVDDRLGIGGVFDNAAAVNKVKTIVIKG